MITNIIIHDNRCLEVDRKTGYFLDIGLVGVTGEKNAEVLHFVKPETINDEPITNFSMRAIVESAGDRYVVDMSTDDLRLDDRYTGGEELNLAVQFLKEGEVKWMSIPLSLMLYSSLSDDENYRNYLNFLKIDCDGKTLDIEYEGNLDIQVNDGYLEVDY